MAIWRDTVVAKQNKRKTVVEFDDEEGLKVRLTVETFNNCVLGFDEQKKLQEHMVDQAVFGIRAAPFLGCPAVQRCKIK
jgi:hypothetical protein